MDDYPEDMLNRRRKKFVGSIRRRNLLIDLISSFGCGTPGFILLVLLILFILAILARNIL